MDVFEIAKKMEVEGKKAYLGMLEKTTNPALKNILRRLAEWEDNHYIIFDAMQQEADLIEVQKATTSEVKEIFSSLKEVSANDEVVEQIEFYEEAINVEQKSSDYYKEIAAEITDETIKKQVLMIADEELKHKKILQEILTYLKQPHSWVESAEFNLDHDNY
jgi:rubrerythrin